MTLLVYDTIIKDVCNNDNSLRQDQWRHVFLMVTLIVYDNNSEDVSNNGDINSFYKNSEDVCNNCDINSLWQDQWGCLQ